MTWCLLVLVDGLVQEVNHHQHVVLCDKLGEATQGVRVQAPPAIKGDVKPESDGDQQSGETDNHHDKLLAEEGGEEATSEKGTEQTVIRLLGGSGLAVLPDWVVVVIISLVTNWGGLGGAITVTACNKQSIEFLKML